VSNCLIIAGLQWGDEGKGKVTDLLAGRADIVARYQGGANAGHTVVVNGRQVILHQVPSGILSPKATCVIGPDVVLDPETLLAEIESLLASGVMTDTSRLVISRAAHVVLPYHKALDGLREKAAGKNRIGTTGRGIGPTYEDMVARRGVRFADFCDPERLARRLDMALPERNAIISHLGGDPFSRDDLVDRSRDLGNVLCRHIGDSGAVLAKALDAGQNVLFESAQGTLLDVLHGTYPFVTSSTTTAAAAFPLSGIGSPQSHTTLGVVKAYTTRVGSGPFPTEDEGEFGTRLQDQGAEFGATTGRPRRCGALDFPTLRYAVRVNGVDRIALTKLDVLSGLDSVRICVAYRLGDETLDVIHPDHFFDPGLTPVYEEMPGWKDALTGIQEHSRLPEKARLYVDRIERELGVPIPIISTGFERDHTIVLEDLWN